MDFLGHRRIRVWHKLIVYHRVAHDGDNSILTAIAMHAKATYGDRRSPGKTYVSVHLQHYERQSLTYSCEFEDQAEKPFTKYQK